MCNFFKCALEAASAHAEVGLYWHFKPVPISLNFNYHQLGLFNDLKRTNTRQVNIGYQCILITKSIKN